MKIVKPDEEVSPNLPGVLNGIKPTEGRVIGYGRKSHWAMIGRRVTMQELADALVGTTGTPVLNETGLQGTFDLDLEFAPDVLSNPDDVPSILDAVQEQLGLKLERRIVPLELLVVDHMEKRPTTN